MVGTVVRLGVSLVMCTLLAACASGSRTKIEQISCDTCSVVAEYGGLAKLTGSAVAARVNEIEVQLESADVIDGLALACDFRNLVVDRRIDAGTITDVSTCDEDRRGPQ